MGLLFEWDINKAKSNTQKHNVSFEEAATIFGDDNSLTIDDIEHSTNEKRKITKERLQMKKKNNNGAFSE
jgi:uncharacterized DUF497 family protein